MLRLPGLQRNSVSLRAAHNLRRCLAAQRQPCPPSSRPRPTCIHRLPFARFSSEPSPPPKPRLPAYTLIAPWRHSSPPPTPCLLTSPPPPPPPYHVALLRWCSASAILLIGFLLELPLLLIWRLLHLLARISPSSSSLSSHLSRLSLLLLSLSYHLRVRYTHLTLHTLHLHLRVINHNPSPSFLLHHPPPHLFIQVNQTSLLDSLAFHAASHLLLLHSLPPSLPPLPPHPTLPFLLSTPHLLLNWEYALFPLLGWVQALTSVWVVRGWTAQARAAVARVMGRMRRGESFYMSVEGRRVVGGDGGDVGEYKVGAGVVAVGVGAVVVPVVMKGLRQAMGVGEWRVREVGVTVVYEEVIDARGMSFEDRRKVIGRIREAYERVRQEEEVEERQDRAGRTAAGDDTRVGGYG